MDRRAIAFRGLLTLTLLACAVASTLLLQGKQRVLPQEVDTSFGVTFSPREVYYLGYDAREAFTAVLDDLGVRDIRFTVYWHEVERQDDVFDFSNVDWFLDEAAKRGARLTVTVGMKVPRWPECHIPEWVSDEERGAELLAYLETVVTRYRDHAAVARWQVENEPHFPFGICPTPDLHLLSQEIALVRELDTNTPIQLTVSGENEPWAATAEQADILGASLYRFAWNPRTGFVAFPQVPEYYGLQALSLGSSVDRVVISELQAEPWFADGIRPAALEDRYAAFTAQRLRDHIRFGQQTGLPEVYLWGVEWWYALRQEGDARLWDTAKEYMQ